MVVESGLASWAIAYADCGFRLFPLRPGEKVPLRRGWQDSATRDHRRLVAMFADETRNLGALTGDRFDVFDIEADHVGRVLEHLGGSWPAAPRSRSGRGGVHLFVEPVGVSGTRRLVLDGVRVGELKSVGGLVVLPPSVTRDQYAWEYAPSGLPPGPTPAALRSLIIEPAVPVTTPGPGLVSAHRAARILAGLVRTVSEAPEGERNSRLFWAACRAHEHELPASVALAALEQAAVATGLPVREVRSTIRSAART